MRSTRPQHISAPRFFSRDAIAFSTTAALSEPGARRLRRSNVLPRIDAPFLAKASAKGKHRSGVNAALQPISGKSRCRVRSERGEPGRSGTWGPGCQGSLRPENRSWPRENAKKDGLIPMGGWRSDCFPMKSFLRSSLCALLRQGNFGIRVRHTLQSRCCRGLECRAPLDISADLRSPDNSSASSAVPFPPISSRGSGGPPL